MNNTKKIMLSLIMCPGITQGISKPAEQKLQQITTAINNVLQKNYTPEEQQWINSLGVLRRDLSTDYTKIGNYTISHMAQIISIPAYPWGALLLKLSKELQPKSILDIGTCIGFSSAYLAAGLEINKQGKLITLETFLPIVPLAQSNFDFLNLNNTVKILAGPITETLPASLKQLSPIDFVFDDHIHDKGPVLRYFENIFPSLNNTAVYVWDDIMRNPSMEVAWKKLKNDPRINVAIEITMGIPYHDFDVVKPRLGICIIDKNNTDKKIYSIDFGKTASVSYSNGDIIQYARS